MVRKTVSLSESAYEKLESEKREHESFSDTVIRLTETPEKQPLTADDVSMIASKTAQEVENRMTGR